MRRAHLVLLRQRIRSAYELVTLLRALHSLAPWKPSIHPEAFLIDGSSLSQMPRAGLSLWIDYLTTYGVSSATLRLSLPTLGPETRLVEIVLVLCGLYYGRSIQTLSNLTGTCLWNALCLQRPSVRSPREARYTNSSNLVPWLPPNRI